MNGTEVLRIVDAIHRDKNIDKEIVFEGIEQAILSAARKHFGEESEVEVDIDRETGEPAAKVNGDALEANEIGELLGRIAAQTAKQVMIQKIREAERDALYEEYDEMRGQIVTGTVSRVDGGSVTVNLGKVEGILPRGEQIPGESHRVGERVRAIIMDVRKHGSRVRIILSRTHPEMVRRLFEIEIPEVAEHVIEVRSLAREAGYRSKVAVSCIDSKIDCVGACVGVRGSRIRNVVDELAGERIDIVRWNDSLQVLVPNALQPAEVEDVILCPMLGKVIVLVQDDQLSLAIGKKGQNVRLASKLVGWDIFVMNQDKLDDQLDNSVTAFSQVPEVSEELAEKLVEQGFFTFDDLSVIEPDQLAELGSLTAEQCEVIIEYADAESLRIEAEERRAYEERRALQEAGVDLERVEKLRAESGDGQETAEADEEQPAVEEAAEVSSVDEEAVDEEAVDEQDVDEQDEESAAEPVEAGGQSAVQADDGPAEQEEASSSEEIAAGTEVGAAVGESPTQTKGASSETTDEPAAEDVSAMEVETVEKLDGQESAGEVGDPANDVEETRSSAPRETGESPDNDRGVQQNSENEPALDESGEEDLGDTSWSAAEAAAADDEPKSPV